MKFIRFCSNDEDQFELVIMKRRDLSYPQEGIQRAVFHVFCYYHNGIGLGNNTLQVNYVRVFELAHNWRLGKEINTSFIWTARFQRFNCDQHFRSGRKFQISSTHVTEFTATFRTKEKNSTLIFPLFVKNIRLIKSITDDGFYSYVWRIDFSGEFSHGLVGIFVRMRIDVGSRCISLSEEWRRH